MEKTGIKYNIYAGLGGGFGGAVFQYSDFFESLEKAEEAAYYAALEEYDSYEGMRGLPTFEDFIEEARNTYDLQDLDDDDPELQTVADEMYRDAVETWIEYYAVPSEDDTNVL